MEQLSVLAESSAELDSHADRRDPTFRHLSRSLRRDVGEIRRSYLHGRIEEARFYVLELTQNCIACHSRLPSAGDFSLAKELTDRVEVAALARRERVNLLFATRQFEAALDTWESSFADPSVSPLDLDVSGELGDYLTLCLRVKQDAGRALRGLAKLKARKDLPRYLHGRIRAWSAALQELKEPGALAFAPDDPASLARARLLVGRANLAGGLSVSPRAADLRSRGVERTLPPARRPPRAGAGPCGSLLPARRHRDAKRRFLLDPPGRVST